jgi:hypothetical protein
MMFQNERFASGLSEVFFLKKKDILKYLLIFIIFYINISKLLKKLI